MTTMPADWRAKTLTREELLTRHRRPRDTRIVFTNGCFDILHRGHVEYLAAARDLGDLLVVGLNADASVARLKGAGRPINSEEDRAAVLGSLAAVDVVTIFHEDTPRELIAQLLPDVLVKGGDYDEHQIVGRDEVTAAGGAVVVIPLIPGRSTTRIIQRATEGAIDG